MRFSPNLMEFEALGENEIPLFSHNLHLHLKKPRALIKTKTIKKIWTVWVSQGFKGQVGPLSQKQ
jgi:hypothetical protein